jgi:hypothetical protein
MNDKERHPPEKDLTATKPVPSEHSEKEPGSDDQGSEGKRPGKSPGGPWGNPEVDEETLRKEQEERRRGGE